ncbi:MAG: hypothetical protein QS721_01045 [Candidatus Endonucleobacter sp. (ex Gigantidas childressi)]|nr:hypothetical protein [Candidatus Endonucleobacter sp. (ex Gigantidas childressi)]
MDNDETIRFSDTPTNSEQEKEVEIEPTNTYKAITPTIVIEKEKKKIVKITYKKLVITEPENGITLNGLSSITVNTVVTPPLHKNHNMVVLLNGKQASKPKHTTKFTLQNLHRGEHNITVQILNKKGENIIEASNTIYIFKPRPIILRNLPHSDPIIIEP